MYQTAFRVIARATGPWLGYVVLAWVLMVTWGAINQGAPVRYLLSFLSSLPAVVAFTLPFALFAGSVAWGDYCDSSGVRRLAPALLVGGVAGLVTLVLLHTVYPAAYALYCDATPLCDLANSPAELLANRYAASSALIAPLNAAFGVFVAWTTAHVHPKGRMRLERWAIAVFVWLATFLLSDVLWRAETAQALGPLGARLIPLSVPSLVALALFWVYRRRGYHF